MMWMQEVPLTIALSN